METKRFKSFKEDFRLFADTSPMLVSVTRNSDNETEEQFIATHDRFIALDDITKDKLAAIKTATIIQNIGKIHNLDSIQMSDIARSIRNYYFDEFKLEEFSFTLAKEMNIDINKARQIFQIIKERIIDDRSYEIMAQAALTTLPLAEALRIYPEVGEQLVTANKINLRSFPYPVRPSIKNWIADYTSTLGYEKHESMARSQYLFQGVNTKNLSAPEKNKLAFLLKSFDENSPVTLNKNTQQVIWPTNNAASVISAGGPARNASPANNALRSNADWHSDAGGPATTPISSNLPKGLADQFRPAAEPRTEPKNINSMQFSYRQKLPYEKTLTTPTPVKALPHEIPVGNRSAERISRGEQNLPKNVVDLKNIQE